MHVIYSSLFCSLSTYWSPYPHNQYDLMLQTSYYFHIKIVTKKKKKMNKFSVVRIVEYDGIKAHLSRKQIKKSKWSWCSEVLETAESRIYFTKRRKLINKAVHSCSPFYNEPKLFWRPFKIGLLKNYTDEHC